MLLMILIWYHYNIGTEHTLLCLCFLLISMQSAESPLQMLLIWCICVQEVSAPHCNLPALLPPLYIVVFTSPHLAFLHSSLCQLHGACICMVHVLQGVVCQLHVAWGICVVCFFVLCVSLSQVFICSGALSIL